MNWATLEGKVITARGPIEPERLGKVMMHEHLHSDWAQATEVPFDDAKWDPLVKYALPAMFSLQEYGCNAWVDMTRPPERAAPWVYERLSELADFHLILCTGYYREIELGKYWARMPEDQIWPFVREASVEELEAFCVKEVEEGIHGSDVHPGVLKIGTSSGELTDTERKAARAVARAQKRTGLLINTHATGTTSFQGQFDALTEEGINPERICFGHTMSALVNAWPAVRECMKAGATFTPTNLRMDVAEATRRAWADAIVRAFDEGLGHCVTLGLDWALTVGYYEFRSDPSWRPHQGDSNYLTACDFMPPPAFAYMFAYTVPRLAEAGVTEEMFQAMFVENPQRILPVRKP